MVTLSLKCVWFDKHIICEKFVLKFYFYFKIFQQSNSIGITFLIVLVYYFPLLVIIFLNIIIVIGIFLFFEHFHSWSRVWLNFVSFLLVFVSYFPLGVCYLYLFCCLDAVITGWTYELWLTLYLFYLCLFHIFNLVSAIYIFLLFRYHDYWQGFKLLLSKSTNQHCKT